MKTDDAKTLVEIIREAPGTDIAVVSFVILPILLTAWAFFLKTIDFLPQAFCGRLFLLSGLIVVYFGTVIIMKRSQATHREKIRAIKHIRNRLEHRSAPYASLASFHYIQRNVNEAYTNEFLFQLIEEFPDDFMRIGCTDGGRKPERPGIKLKQEDSE